MALDESQPLDTVAVRKQVLSKGHNPPKYVDQEIPTFESTIFGMGGPARTFLRTQGTHPWIAGSLTIGSNHVFNVSYKHFQSSSPNVYFILRHSHSGTNSTPGGTIDVVHLPAAGRSEAIGRPDAPIRSIRGPGTLFVYGFGARRALTGSTPFRALGTGVADQYSALIRGWME